MKHLFALCLIASSVALAACSSAGNGKTYPAPYAHERTAGAVGEAPAAEPVFEKKMTK